MYQYSENDDSLFFVIFFLIFRVNKMRYVEIFHKVQRERGLNIHWALTEHQAAQ